MNPSTNAPAVASLLTLEGPDALAFAHAQFTSDVQALAIGAWQWSAWLDARGRVRCLMQLARPHEDRLVALLRGGRAEDMGGGLSRYLFRSRVTLVPGPTQPVGAGPAMDAFAVDVDDDAYAFGLEGRSLVIPAKGIADHAWRLEAIRHGEPWLPVTCMDTLLPPALGLRRLGALSLDKGCFPGQEVAARLHYRGGHKHALAHVRLAVPALPGADALGQHDPDAATLPARVLDCVARGDAHEALVVMHERELDRLADTGTSGPGGAQLVRRFAP